MTYFSANGETIFDSKTQEYPFHYGMLAVGMLFETRFPKRALVLGDISVEQARSVKEWADVLLHKPLTLPVIMDEKRLWKRLLQTYKDDRKLAMERFSALYRGSHSNVEAFVHFGLNSEDLEPFIETELESYRSLNQIGPMRIVDSMLESLGLKETMKILGRINKRREIDKRFEFQDMAFPLVHKFITFPPEDKAVITNMLPSHSSLMNIEETFSRTVAMLIGKGPPETINQYITKDELIEIFLPLITIERKEFVRKIDEGIARCAELLESIRKAISSDGSIEKKGEKKDKKLSDKDCVESCKSSGFDELVKREAMIQMIVRKSPEEMNETMAVIREVITDFKSKFEEAEKISNEEDRYTLLTQLYEYVHQAGFAPLEESWHLIDSEETEIEECRALCILAMIKWNAYGPCQMRRFIFDHPQLWPFLSHERDGIGRLPGDILEVKPST